MSLNTILTELSLVEDNDEMLYDYIISKSDSLIKLDESEFSENTKIHGCMSTVYLLVEHLDKGTIIKGYSDSLIVSGILGILSESVSDISNPNIEEHKILLDKIHFLLSQNRRLGLKNIINKIYFWTTCQYWNL